MSAKRSQRRPALESLEDRLVLSAAANTLSTAHGVVARPREVSQTVSPIQEANLARPKHSTIIALFARPSPGSRLDPKIVSTRGPNGAHLPIRHGAPFRAGMHPAAAFTKVSQPGPLTTGVTGRDGTTGGYGLSTTLPGDINGDGKVDLSDMQAFAPAYLSHIGDGFYNPAADANHNGFIGQGDAKLMVRNLAPITPRIPLNVQVALAPGQYVHNSGFIVSGGITNRKEITIVGKTTPGSAIFVDSGLGDFSFTGPFLTTDARGNFSLQGTNKEGLTNYQFLVID
ncbi:MAG: dockerin type I domain-containing protein, partial [Isosphaeraceae bacterium]